MNQRIRELAEQAGFTEWHRMDNPNGDAVIQTFAELIVRECANLPFKSTGEVTTIGEIAVSNMILKHFGVE
jgi:hypothetical protein